MPYDIDGSEGFTWNSSEHAELLMKTLLNQPQPRTRNHIHDE
jgi:hypothetical protein